MSDARSEKFYQHLRKEREADAMFLVAEKLLNRDLLNRAIATSRVFNTDKINGLPSLTGLSPTAQQEILDKFDWVEFIFTEFNPYDHLVSNRARIFPYLAKALGLDKDKFGYSATTKIEDVSREKLIEAILLYAACFDLETDYELDSAKYHQQMAGQSDGVDSGKMLTLLKEINQVIQSGRALDGKFDILEILLKRIIRENDGKDKSAQIPREVVMTMVKLINVMHNEIRELNKSRLPKFINNSYIDLIAQKIAALEIVLKVNSLAKAQSIAAEMDADDPEFMDGKTGGLIRSLMTIPAKEQVPTINPLKDMKNHLSSIDAVNDAIDAFVAFDVGSITSYNAKEDEHFDVLVEHRKAQAMTELEMLSKVPSTDKSNFAIYLQLQRDEILNKYGFVDAQFNLSDKVSKELRGIAEKRARAEFDYVGFMASDEFDPSLHFVKNYDRIYPYLADCFSNENLEKFQLSGSLANTRENKEAIARAIILASVSQILEDKYLSTRQPIIDKVMAMMKDPNIPEATKRKDYDVATKSGYPLSRSDMKYNHYLGTFMRCVDKVVKLNSLKVALNNLDGNAEFKKLGLEIVNQLSVTDTVIKHEDQIQIMDALQNCLHDSQFNLQDLREKLSARYKDNPAIDIICDNFKMIARPQMKSSVLPVGLFTHHGSQPLKEPAPLSPTELSPSGSPDTKPKAK